MTNVNKDEQTTINNQKKKDLAARRVAQGALLKKILFFLRSALELVCSLFLVFPTGLDHTRNWDFDHFRSDRIREIGTH